MASIEFDRVSKAFDDGSLALAELELSAEDGEFLVIVGPSGSGKSTALRIVAGLEDPSAGTVRVGGRIVNDVAPKDRDIAMVFQSYALYPHMSVSDNLSFALKMRGEGKEQMGSQVGRVAGRLSISRLLERLPRQLSGGQRQRVALGRAIVREPQAFLMDEPLSNLDAKLRVEMRAYIGRLHRELGTTTLYVTHDQTEAMTMGDRVAVLRDGRLEQVGVPQALYDRPTNVFVAGFIGSPAMSLVRGRLERDGDGLALSLGTHRLPVPRSVARRHPGLRDHVEGELVVGMRPETLSLANGSDGASPAEIEANVELVEALGSDLLVHFELDAPAVLTGSTLEVAEDLQAGGSGGGAALATRRPDRAWVTARLATTARPRSGTPIRLRVDPERLHFFDPESEQALA
jgi:multiple sugar transport system ATP-binding protein